MKLGKRSFRGVKGSKNLQVLKRERPSLRVLHLVEDDAKEKFMKSTGPLYDGMFRRLEAIRWTLSEVPFDRIDKSRITEENVEFIRVNCLMELSSLYAVRMFLRDFKGNVDFCQFMSIWYYEEMKHYLVLREYLKVFGREPQEEELPPLDTEHAPAPWVRTLVLHFCGELRLGMWYYRWSQVFQEPVLKSIYQLIGNDEYRHAACYEEFMIKAFKQNPAVLLDFLQVAKWMLYNPEGDKHPTTMRANGPDDPSVAERIPGYERFHQQIINTITDEDEERLCRRILVTLSKLANCEMKSPIELSAYTRNLERRQIQDKKSVQRSREENIALSPG